MSTPRNLTAAIDDRKARLAKLKSLKRKQPTDEIVPPESDRSPSPPPHSTPHLSGRNYDPETRGPKLGFESAPVGDGPTLEEQAAEVRAQIAEKAKEEEASAKGIDLFKLQPKKPNWDLKRDLDAKLEVLNTRTDNAIARLVRERVARAQEGAKGGAAEAKGDGAAAGMDGVTLVEGVRVREREEEEEERREREELEE
ncbi:uncharacterized protein DNG_09292 [Cephalotrichum gorgonifer]|uniref:Cwf18 domain-containing protein n=1 Tax=Cephalotrichum gorgonifer TaxID=2041049 RepID=A0AAE8T001_9PEZI|nr:uncharacterized protein DNG_09292 [Cephalotrichum gorgonifer]